MGGRGRGHELHPFLLNSLCQSLQIPASITINSEIHPGHDEVQFQHGSQQTAPVLVNRLLTGTRNNRLYQDCKPVFLALILTAYGLKDPFLTHGNKSWIVQQNIFEKKTKSLAKYIRKLFCFMGIPLKSHFH
jgi:hypothetical protein